MYEEQDREISVDNMDGSDDEDMDQTSSPTPALTSVIVSHPQGDLTRHSPSVSPLLQVSAEHAHRLLATKPHLQVRQTLSEPGRNPHIQRPRMHRLSPTRLSPLQTRKHHDLGKTLSVGAALDSSSVQWKPTVASTGQLRVEGTMTEASDETTPSMSPLSLGGANTTARIPTQEQLEALYKLPTSHEQLEIMQKNMMVLMEQQQKQQAAEVSRKLQASHSVGLPTSTAGSTGGPGELFQFPMALWPLGIPAGATPTFQLQPTTGAGSNSATSSPTPSNSSSDSSSTMSALPPTVALMGDTLSLGIQRRPLSESVSAPGFGSAPVINEGGQFDPLMRQFQLQQQQILLQGQQMQQRYLEQQQRLIQQAVLERKQFEEKQQQMAALHLHQQQELQKKQQLLRQMQEAQLLNLQRQILFQNMSQPRFVPTQQAPIHKPVVQRLSKDSALPFAKPVLSATNSSGSSSEMGRASSMDGINRSPSLTPKALTPTNSYDSGASNNGRGSPNVGVASPSSGQELPVQGGTGLVYDTMMLKHSCNCGGSHPEHPGRLQSIWARLHETKVVMNCRRLRARKSSLAELQSIHSENHVRLYGRPSQRKPGQERKDPSRTFVPLTCGGVGVDRDTYWNDSHTSNAARMAVGSVIELADKILSGEVRNGFAFVRPPGHHALPNQAMAFCYFNNVAVAAKSMLSKNKRVAIVDWDIHHGNGTQQIFYDNSNVLYISVHRYDNGTFFPGTGRPEEIGSGAGLGFNVNVAFSGSQNFQGVTMSNFGDAEYLSVFRSLVVPICREFNPDLILVSAGFNATEGHPPTLGGYSVSPKCFSVLTRMLMSVGAGRVALALEGGYELMSLCASAETCMRALLGLDLPQMDSASLDRPPQAAAVASMEKTIAVHKNYWSCLSRSASLMPLSHSEAEKRELEESDAVTAMASLSVAGDGQQRLASVQTAV
ncbi:histone deacetylase 4-like [Halichondria panicea]|uniref:histone deacetylase 4-like n=1 Tax=Halichondria panicea TaxID=6063 RepID=UPI00312B5D41